MTWMWCTTGNGLLCSRKLFCKCFLTFKHESCPLACFKYCAKMEVGNGHTVSRKWTTFTRITWNERSSGDSVLLSRSVWRKCCESWTATVCKMQNWCFGVCGAPGWTFREMEYGHLYAAYHFLKSKVNINAWLWSGCSGPISLVVRWRLWVDLETDPDVLQEVVTGDNFFEISSCRTVILWQLTFFNYLYRYVTVIIRYAAADSRCL